MNDSDLFNPLTDDVSVLAESVDARTDFDGG